MLDDERRLQLWEMADVVMGNRGRKVVSENALKIEEEARR